MVVLDFRISKPFLMRALLLMDTLLKQLEKLGYEVAIPDSGETVVAKGDVQMKIGLYERFRRFEQILTEKQKLNWWRYDKYRFEPSGEFDLSLSRRPLHERHWKDSPKRKLEDRLTDIVVEIVRSRFLYFTVLYLLTVLSLWIEKTRSRSILWHGTKADSFASAA